MSAPACAGCRGRCCRTYVVPITGGDAFRLSQHLQAPIDAFTRMVASHRPADGAIRFSAGDERHQLALVHREDSTCIFAIELVDGDIRCGVYDERPVVCRSYPLEARGEEAVVRRDVICDGQPTAPPDLGGWRDLVAREAEAWSTYRAALTGWNEAAAQLDDGVRATPASFATWLTGVYDELTALGTDDPAELRLRAASIGRALASAT